MGVGTVAGIGDDVGCMVDGSATVGAVADATNVSACATVPAIASVGDSLELGVDGEQLGESNGWREQLSGSGFSGAIVPSTTPSVWSSPSRSYCTASSQRSSGSVRWHIFCRCAL